MTFSDLFKVTIIQRQENGIAYSYTYNGRPIESRIMIYRTVPLSVTLNDLSLSRLRHYLTLNISETVRHRHSFNEIPIGTYTRPTQQCYFE